MRLTGILAALLILITPLLARAQGRTATAPRLEVGASGGLAIAFGGGACLCFGPRVAVRMADRTAIEAALEIWNITREPDQRFMKGFLLTQVKQTLRTGTRDRAELFLTAGVSSWFFVARYDELTLTDPLGSAWTRPAESFRVLRAPGVQVGLGAQQRLGAHLALRSEFQVYGGGRPGVLGFRGSLGISFPSGR